jgi:hypothetical protein
MRFGLLFLLLSFGVGFLGLQATPPWVKALLWSTALCFGCVGLAFLWIGPRAFLKRPDGSLSAASWLLYWPYHTFNQATLAAVAWLGSDRPADEIAPNLYLGRQLTVFDRGVLKTLAFTAVLDLTSEFSELPALRKGPEYRCIPLLDTFAPTREQLIAGVQFIRRHIADGPVLVHCALGHGRSATLAAAYLMAAGVADDTDSAEKLVRMRRPGVKLSIAQRAALNNLGAPALRACLREGERAAAGNCSHEASR